MFGNIVKVTPSSKVVGDMALFMTSNGLSKEDVLNNGTELSYPDSVINFFKGDLGQPVGRFPKELQKQILKGDTPIEGRPNVHLEPVDFEKGFKDFKRKFDKDSSFTDSSLNSSIQRFMKTFSNTEKSLVKYHTCHQKHSSMAWIQRGNHC